MDNKKTSLIVYICFLAITMAPVWLLDYYHTGDGPTHLYSANIFRRLLFDQATSFGNFFEITNLPVPNSVVQCLFGAMLFFISSQLANKICITVVILLMVYGYNKMARVLSKDQDIIPLFIFFLVFCLPLKMGFYSFLLGVGLLLFALSYYIKSRDDASAGSYIQLIFWITLVWFTHFFDFAALLVSIVLFEFAQFVIAKAESKKYDFRKIIKPALAVLPGVILSFLFSGVAIDSNIIRYSDFTTLLNGLIECAVLMSFGTAIEFYVLLLFKLLFILSIVSVVPLIMLDRRKLSFPVLYLCSIIVVFLIFYFIMPMNFFGGGIINLRFSYFIFLFLFLLLEFVLANKRGLKAKIFLSGVVMIFLSVNNYVSLKEYNEELRELITAENFIEPGKTVLPLNYSNQEFHYNYALYLSSDKEIIMLDNGEAASANGLVKWKENKLPLSQLGNYLQSRRPMVELANYEAEKGIKVNYILRWCWNENYNDKATLRTNELIGDFFQPVYRSTAGRVEVFKRIN